MTDSVKLNKIVAVEKGSKSRTTAALTSAYHIIQKPDQFNGIARSYTPKLDDGDKLPDENQVIQANTNHILTSVSHAIAEYFDVIATKDWGNTVAKADVVVDGKVIIAAAPVTYLLFLEKFLVDVKTFVSKLPTLPTTERWSWDEGYGAYKSETTQTAKTKKVPGFQVLYEATPEHPAQIREYTEDIVVGFWSTTKFSTAIYPSDIVAMEEKIVKLIEAVKFAREEANMTDVEQIKVGKAVMDYIFN